MPKTNFNGVFSMVLLDAVDVGVFTRRTNQKFELFTVLWWYPMETFVWPTKSAFFNSGIGRRPRCENVHVTH